MTRFRAVIVCIDDKLSSSFLSLFVNKISFRSFFHVIIVMMYYHDTLYNLLIDFTFQTDPNIFADTSSPELKFFVQLTSEFP